MRTPEEHERMREERMPEERMPEDRTPEGQAPEGRAAEQRTTPDPMPQERMPEEGNRREEMDRERMPGQPGEMPAERHQRMDPGHHERSSMAIPDADSYIQRFEAVQAEFIDEPRRAVERAESLVSEAIDRMMSSLKQDLQRSRTQGAGTDETEQLRMAMKRYREILFSFSQRAS